MTAALEKVNGTPMPAAHAEPRFDAVALAEADAIRTRAEADAEARRIEAEGKAKAAEATAREEADKQRLANERAAMRLERERAEHAVKVAEANRKRQEAERLAAEARAQAEAEEQAAAVEQGKREQSARSWRRAALGFAIVCGIVALPVQMSAFWSPHAPWLLVAPLVLEGGAWVVLKGAAAAVDDRRPHWHYRMIAWGLAFLAAGINLSHGLRAFDVATAAGTAFASLAGPGVWDLHEHGRIRVRDGKLTRRERRAQRAEAKRAAAEKAATEARQRADKQAAEEAARVAAEELAAARAETYPEEWAHALKLAAALGETAVTEAVWARAWDDLHAAKPGVTVDAIRLRNAAARRLAAAHSEAPDGTPAKASSPQAVIQMKASRSRSGYRPVPPRRTKNDTAPYHPLARAAASDTKRRSNAAKRAARPARKES